MNIYTNMVMYIQGQGYSTLMWLVLKSNGLKSVVYGLYNVMFKKIINSCITWVILKIKKKKESTRKASTTQRM